MKPSKTEQKLIEIDKQIVNATKGIKLLSKLSWPIEIQYEFLNHWQKKKAKLPTVEYPKLNMTDLITDVRALAKKIDRAHPLGEYLYKTAQSYITVSKLLQSIGTDKLTKHSIKLYGKPGHLLTGSHTHNIEAAEHFINIAGDYAREYSHEQDSYSVSSETLKQKLLERIREVFIHHTVEVVIDEHLAAKATAGATKIKLRGGTCYTPHEFGQLLEHEAFVHTLTALNGREQPYFKTLGLGSPRTTATQEGLATFAELITGAIDINRMERIALRIVGIDKALNGADFIEVFKYFLEAGQNEIESFNSTMRIFRGVPVTGGSAFTKDTVYLHGLMSVHTFFRWAMMHKKLDLCKLLFAGRMTISDVITLEPYFKSNLLAPPLYLPPWITRTNGLAGYLSFSVFTNKIHIHELHGSHFPQEAS